MDFYWFRNGSAAMYWTYWEGSQPPYKNGIVQLLNGCCFFMCFLCFCVLILCFLKKLNYNYNGLSVLHVYVANTYETDVISAYTLATLQIRCVFPFSRGFRFIFFFFEFIFVFFIFFLFSVFSLMGLINFALILRTNDYNNISIIICSYWNKKNTNVKVFHGYLLILAWTFKRQSI